MIESVLPIVSIGERHPAVRDVRDKLNLLGDDLLDAPLAEILRGVQSARNLPVSGCVDHATLSAVGLELSD
jgi:hypothetical protein